MIQDKKREIHKAYLVGSGNKTQKFMKNEILDKLHQWPFLSLGLGVVFFLLSFSLDFLPAILSY